MMTITKCAAATFVLTGIMAWLNHGGNSAASAVFADEIPGVDRVKEMTWSQTYYSLMSNRNGSDSWISKERRMFAYRHPHQFRETRMNAAGEVISVHITDHSANRTLDLWMKDRKAVLKTPDRRHDGRGPFAWVGDELRDTNLPPNTRVKSVSIQGTTSVDDLAVNVVRVVVQDVELGKSSQHDLYFDQNTKRLAGIWGPNDPSLTREDVESRVEETDKAWYRFEPIAALTHEINLTPQLQAADFSLDAPEGFELESVARPTVTELEMLEFLGAAVRFNNGVFPDTAFVPYDRDRLNKEWSQEEDVRSAEASKLIAAINRIRFREIYESPVKRFVDDNTMPDSFHYVGSGVKEGQADSLICWYQTRSGKTWRAVYGDLTIRNVAQSELPFKVTD
jgi:hypothetical protein